MRFAKIPSAIAIAALSAALLLALMYGVRAQDSRLNLRDAELSAFIELVAQITGRNFIVDPRVRGTVTIVAPDAIEPEAVFRIFLNVLELNRFTLVEGDGADRIVPAQVARELSPDERADPPKGFVTKVMRVEYMPMNEAVEVIRPLLAPEAVLTAFPTGRLLIISDREPSIGRVERLLVRIDRPRETQVEVVTLLNANAERVAKTLGALEFTSPGATVAHDPRSNTLLVTGPEAFRAQVRALAAELDQPRNIADATVVRLRYADAANIEKIVSKLFASTSGGGESNQGGDSSPAIVADETTNSVLITARPDRISSIVAAVRALDQRPVQVLIEGMIFEMSTENFAQLGAQFGALISQVFAGGVQFNVGGVPSLGALVTTVLAGNTPVLSSGASIAAGTTIGSDGAAVAFLSALARDTSTNILATPSVLTLENEEAKIIVAQNVPFVTGRFSTVGEDAIPNQPFQTIQRQDIGLTLTVKPQITGDGDVRMKVSQEVSNLTTTASAAGGEITLKRAIDTNILVGDGSMVLLGGLLEEASEGERERVPGLGDIPVLSYLFSSKSAEGSQRILLLLLRPAVIRTDAEARQATDKTVNRARSESAELASRLDDRYPRMSQTTLPTMLPKLGAPFRASGIGGSTKAWLLPPLPPRLQFGEP